jgi:hypothetical protein
LLRVVEKEAEQVCADAELYSPVSDTMMAKQVSFFIRLAFLGLMGRPGQLSPGMELKKWSGPD